MKTMAVAMIFCGSSCKAIADPIEPRIARLILEDVRLTAFAEHARANYPEVNCGWPSPDHLDGAERCVGDGDFRSCYYGFTVQCSQLPAAGPHAVHVNAELFPLAQRILNLGITTWFLQ